MWVDRVVTMVAYVGLIDSSSSLWVFSEDGKQVNDVPLHNNIDPEGREVGETRQ